MLWVSFLNKENNTLDFKTHIKNVLNFIIKKWPVSRLSRCQAPSSGVKQCQIVNSIKSQVVFLGNGRTAHCALVKHLGSVVELKGVEEPAHVVESLLTISYVPFEQVLVLQNCRRAAYQIFKIVIREPWISGQIGQTHWDHKPEYLGEPGLVTFCFIWRNELQDVVGWSLVRSGLE